MTIIKHSEASENSPDWQEVLDDAHPGDITPGDGRIFVLTRALEPREALPISDLELAVTCDIDFGWLNGEPSVRVDQPLVLIVQAYLHSLN